MRDLTSNPIGGHTAQPDFQLLQLWYVSVASMTLQALVSLALVRSEFRKRLVTAAAPQPAAMRARN